MEELDKLFKNITELFGLPDIQNQSGEVSYLPNCLIDFYKLYNDGIDLPFLHIYKSRHIEKFSIDENYLDVGECWFQCVVLCEAKPDGKLIIFDPDIGYLHPEPLYQNMYELISSNYEYFITDDIKSDLIITNIEDKDKLSQVLTMIKSILPEISSLQILDLLKDLPCKIKNISVEENIITVRKLKDLGVKSYLKLNAV